MTDPKEIQRQLPVNCGMCPHPQECRQWGACRMEEELLREQAQQPSAEELCAAADHAYYGDDRALPEEVLGDPLRMTSLLSAGTCYCGEVRYPYGGRLELTTSGILDPGLPTREGTEVVFEKGAL